MSKNVVIRDFNGTDETVFGFQARGTILGEKASKEYVKFLINLGLVKEFGDDEEIIIEGDKFEVDDEHEDYASLGGASTEGTIQVTSDLEAVKAALEDAKNKEDIKEALKDHPEVIKALTWNKSIANLKADALEALGA